MDTTHELKPVRTLVVQARRDGSQEQTTPVMAEVAIEDRVFRYETKPQPTANAPGKIVEAFGLGKCPKLAEQVCAASRHT